VSLGDQLLTGPRLLVFHQGSARLRAASEARRVAFWGHTAGEPATYSGGTSSPARRIASNVPRRTGGKAGFHSFQAMNRNAFHFPKDLEEAKAGRRARRRHYLSAEPRMSFVTPRPQPPCRASRSARARSERNPESSNVSASSTASAAAAKRRFPSRPRRCARKSRPATSRPAPAQAGAAPAPNGAAPSDPAPSDPAPSDPAPSDPAPSGSAPEYPSGGDRSCRCAETGVSGNDGASSETCVHGWTSPPRGSPLRRLPST